MNRKQLDRRSMIQAGLAFLGMSAAIGCSKVGSSITETAQASPSNNQRSNRDAVEAYFTA
jgi:hypothetical protein